VIDWLFTNALAALGLAIIAIVLIWTFRPAPAVRHALWLVVLLKLVSPTGLVVEVPLPVENPTPVLAEATHEQPAVPTDPGVVEELFDIYVIPQPGQSADEVAVAQVRRESDAATATRSSTGVSEKSEAVPAPPAATASEFRPATDYQPYLLGLWVAGAVLIGVRQLRETARFARFTRYSRPAPDWLVSEVAIVANRLGVRVPAVRVMTGLTSPVIWCLWRPVLLWPAGLEGRLKGEGRRAVLAHELAHLRRRDHWVRRLEMVAAVLHWWNPLFWVARKKMRADAELACDAWAAGQADRRAYAEALLEVCSFNPRRRPAPAVGVFGEGRRAMQERLTMIMRDRVPCRLAFGAKLVVALMAIAAVPAWTLGPGVEPAAAQSAASDEQVKELEAQIKALAAQLEALKSRKAAEAQKADALKAKTEALNKAQIELKGKIKAADEKARVGEKVVREVITQGQPAMKVVTAGEDGYKVIGPDGKELKDVKIIISPKPGATAVVKPGAQGVTARTPMVVDAQTGKVTLVPSVTTNNKFTTASVFLSPDGKNYSWTTKGEGAGGQTVTLSRATYKLNKDQAGALATLLGSIKAPVMETKIDGDSIVVTTTPEIQATIGQIVRLVQGQGGQTTFEWKVAPTAPTAPTKPTPPTPVKPAKPAKPEKPGDGAALELKFDNLEIPLETLKNLKIELENTKDLEKLKDLKIELQSLKELEKLKDVKIEVEKMNKEKLKDLKINVEKLKELENLKDLKDVEKLKDAIKLLVPAEKAKPDREKKPDEPAK
jgi:beta-lactamase regulating signal transducer with metallopeptidase domain